MTCIYSIFERFKNHRAAAPCFLLLAFGILFFQRLGNLPLIGTDEARYSEIPREMLEKGDFLTPTLNYVPYFEKPPLHYWLNAISMRIFGETEFAARFFGALWGVLGVLMVYHLGCKLFDRKEGFLSALILGTSVGYLVQGRMNITDTTLTFFLCASLGSFLLAIQPKEDKKNIYFYLFYFFAALAVLAKGLIGVILPFAIILLYSIVTRNSTILKEMNIFRGTLLFLLISSPWFLIVAMGNKDFLNFFFIHEHFVRYLTTAHGRYQPPWFYLPVLIGCMLPWSFFIPTAVSGALRKQKETGGSTKLFLLIWASFILIFFSFSHSKLVPYILPAYPALALVLGAYFADIKLVQSTIKTPVKILTFFSVVLSLGFMLYPHLAKSPRISASGGVLLCVLFALQVLMLLVSSGKAPPSRIFNGLVITSFALGILGPPIVFEGIAKRKLTRELALMAQAKAGTDGIIATFGYQQELPFYTKRRIVVVGQPGELEFGSKQGNNNSWFVSEKEFGVLWKGGKPVYAIVAQSILNPLAKTLHPTPTVLGIQADKALITNLACSPDHLRRINSVKLEIP